MLPNLVYFFEVTFMKKTIAMILCVLLIMICMTACGCKHEYTSSVTKEPTYDSTGEMTYVCSKCNKTYTESIEKLEKHVVPTSVLDDALSKSKYYSSPFSISVGKLVNSAMDNYKIKYLTGEDAIKAGIVAKNDIDSSIDINYLYYAIISGDTMMTPDMPYMTAYEEEAVIAWMIFDQNNQLVNSGVRLCDNLETCAILLMTSEY